MITICNTLKKLILQFIISYLELVTKSKTMMITRSPNYNQCVCYNTDMTSDIYNGASALIAWDNAKQPSVCPDMN